jgi:hypothetical protein
MAKGPKVRTGIGSMETPRSPEIENVILAQRFAIAAQWCRCVGAILAVLILMFPALGIGADGDTNATAGAAKQQLKPNKKASVAPEVQAMIDESDDVPPDLGADTLIRLAETGAISTRKEKIKLFTKAFELAASTEQPVRRHKIGGLKDTRSGMLDAAFRLNLDRLSLQSRVLKDMLPLDTGKARDLLEQMSFPELAPVGCDDPMAYDVSAFYGALTAVVKNGFTPNERQEGLHSALLMQYVGNLQSHAQVAPITHMLLEADLSSSEMEQAVSIFGNALSQLTGDEQNFSAAYPPGALSPLLEKLDARGIPSFAFIQAIRRYMVANFCSVSCSDSLVADIQRGSLPANILFFNQRYAHKIADGEVAPISSEELSGSRAGPKPSDPRFWLSARAKELLAAITRLRLGDGRATLDVSERKTAAWSAQEGDFLAKMEGWQRDSSEEPDADWFHMKCLLYIGLIELVPPGSERSEVVRRYVQFLTKSSDTVSSVEKYLHIHYLFSESKDLGEIRRDCVNSGDPVLRLWAELNEWENQKREH